MLNKDAFIISFKLFLITAISALCLAFVNKVTTPAILINQQKTIEDTQKELLPDATLFETVDFKGFINESTEGTNIEDFCEAKNGEKLIGYIVTVVSKNGYGGEIKVMVGLTEDLVINKVKITETHETAGLGLKASDPEFIEQFTGKEKTLKVIKNVSPKDDEIQAISGATVTSKAVAGAVNTALDFVKTYNEQNKNLVYDIVSEISEETEKQIKEDK